MESIQIATDPATAVPQVRDEVYCPFKKFILASVIDVPSYDSATGAPGGATLFWEVLYDGDPNNYITLQPGYINLTKPGMYMVSSRVTFRLDTPGNSQRLIYMQADLEAIAGANQGDGDVAQISVGSSGSTLYLSESSPGAGDSGGSSVLTQLMVVVDDPTLGTIYAAPRAVFVFAYQESDSLQSQALLPHNYDVWLQVIYLGMVDTFVDGSSAVNQPVGAKRYPPS